MSVNNNVLFESGGCSDDPLNFNCYCFGLASSNDLKIYDVATRTFECCGNVGLQYTQNYPQPLGNRDPTKNILLNAALTSNSKCFWWWNGSANNFPPDYLASNPPPTPGQGWYFPDGDGLVNGLMPSVYGPNQSQISVIVNQSYINEIIALPSTTLGGLGLNSSTTIQCPSDPDKNYITYWLRYRNPNYRGNFYNVTLVCADLNTVKASKAYAVSDFALFQVKCSLQDTPGTYTCTQRVGEITNFEENQLGTLVLTSQNYGGGKPPFPGTTTEGATNYLWLLILIVCLIVVVVIIAVVLLYFNYSKTKKNPPRKK